MAKKYIKKKTKKYPPFDLNRYIINVLRRASYKLRSRGIALEKARVHYGKYKCAHCAQVFDRQSIQVDHTLPVVPISGFDTWDGYIKRLFCSPEELQILCKPCHKMKSNIENKKRRANVKKT